MAPRRTYDASGRQARAAERREAVLAAARDRFLEKGYAGTSLPAVAGDAGVSVEYLHKAFDGKAGLVKALYERSLLGAGSVPAPERSDAAQEQETDARALMRRFGAFMAEVTPLVAPMQRLIRDAAAGGDPAMAALHQQVEDERYARMLHNARRVHARGLLRPDVTAEQAADLFWSVTGAELYERLVLQRGWSTEAFAAFIGRTFTAALVD
jgi:AcrR family transcriptional regulator